MGGNIKFGILLCCCIAVGICIGVALPVLGPSAAEGPDPASAPPKAESVNPAAAAPSPETAGTSLVNLRTLVHQPPDYVYAALVQKLEAEVRRTRQVSKLGQDRAWLSSEPLRSVHMVALLPDGGRMDARFTLEPQAGGTLLITRVNLGGASQALRGMTPAQLEGQFIGLIREIENGRAILARN